MEQYLGVSRVSHLSGRKGRSSALQGQAKLPFAQPAAVAKQWRNGQGNGLQVRVQTSETGGADVRDQRQKCPTHVQGNLLKWRHAKR